MATGTSLHIGLDRVSPDRYAGWDGALWAGERDAVRMAGLATVAGFGPEMLLTAEATRDNVEAALSDAAATLAAGDVMLITYAGHGGRLPDPDGDEDDLWDETWCLFDAQMIDDELRNLYARFRPGVRVIVVSDSCHSGTVIAAAPPDSRAPAGLRFRTMPPSVELPAFEARHEEYRARQDSLRRQPAAAPTASIRLLAACQDDQFAIEERAGGLFTRTLLEVWSTSFGGDYEAFVGELRRRMPPRQQPSQLTLGAADEAFNHQRPFSI